MSVKTANHRNPDRLEAVSLSAGVQVVVLSMLGIAWVGTAIFTAATVIMTQGSIYYLVLLGLTVVLPVVFFLTALSYAWHKYTSLLHKVFVAGVLATSGYAAAQVLFSFIFMLNNHFNWVGTDYGTNDVPTYIFEWTVMLIGYAAFVIVLGCLPRGKKKAD